MDKENMVCINMLCEFNDELYLGRCTKGLNEPKIYECEDSVICCEGHPVIDKISQIKVEAGENRPTEQSLKCLCSHKSPYGNFKVNGIVNPKCPIHGKA